jgi:hypothetical protein
MKLPTRKSRKINHVRKQPQHIRKYKSGKVRVVNKGIKPHIKPRDRFKSSGIKSRNLSNLNITDNKDNPKPKLTPRDLKSKFNFPPSYASSLDATGMALMFFFVDFENKFSHLPQKTILNLGHELSEVSMLAPLSYPPSHYKPNEFKRMFPNIERKMKLIDVNSKNQFSILNSDYRYSPLQLHALFIWVMYKLAPDLKNKSGYEWISNAETLFKKK